jgi:hypothetical protein
VYTVTATLLAGRQLSRVPGLYHDVRRVLTGMLETAHEIRKLQRGYMPVDPPLFFIERDHVIWYALDLEKRIATILVVEPISGLEGGSAQEPIAS